MSAVASRVGAIGWTAAQWYCVLVGGGLALRGVLGALMGDYSLPGDGWHQVFHLVSGLALVAVARRADWALAGTLVFGVTYTLFAIAGFAGADALFGVIEIEGRSNVLHAGFAALALAAAFVARPVSRGVA
jgi:hypothetical protein